MQLRLSYSRRSSSTARVEQLVVSHPPSDGQRQKVGISLRWLPRARLVNLPSQRHGQPSPVPTPSTNHCLVSITAQTPTCLSCYGIFRALALCCDASTQAEAAVSSPMMTDIQ